MLIFQSKYCIFIKAGNIYIVNSSFKGARSSVLALRHPQMGLNWAGTIFGGAEHLVKIY